MSVVPDLGSLGRGFAAPAFGSQAVFRRALEALSRPGRIVGVESDAQPPAGLDTAACALALSLLDQDTTLWCSPALRRPEVGGYLRFHTGCLLAQRAEEAHFILAAAHELPPIDGLAAGSDDYPDRSATAIVQVTSLSGEEAWRLSGPGIRDAAPLSCAGLPADFAAQWKRNGERYPRGVDLFLTCGRLVCGMPRTTRIEA